MSRFVRPRRVREPAVRLIGFHHAGGSASSYYPLARHLPPDWEVLLHEQPGRGVRRSEPLLREMEPVVEAAVGDVTAYAEGPYALFGHSMGAVVAAEVGRRLAAACRPPVWVGVSGRAAPQTPAPRGTRLSQLDSSSLFTTLLQLGGTPARVGDEPELRDLLLRVARADLEAVDSYHPDPARSPLPCPLTAFGGVTDGWAPPASLPAWEQETGSLFRQCLLPGGHFYFLDSAFASLAREVRIELATALARHDREGVPAAGKP